MRVVKSQESDENLAMKWKAGDQSAGAALYLRHQAATYRFLWGRTQNKATAEDLQQSVWIQLVEGIERYEPKASFRTYLLRIASNRFIDWYRSKEAHVEKDNVELPTHQGDDDRFVIFDALVDKGTPEGVAMRNQALEVLTETLQRLPEPQGTAFTLAAEAGCSVKEIAEIQNVTEESAKKRYAAAKRRIETALRAVLPDHSFALKRSDLGDTQIADMNADDRALLALYRRITARDPDPVFINELLKKIVNV